jgi:2,5-diamino-6-(ribosylamino)-4(3H)-pyrimidinone 5'-phosphate reductase
MSEQRTLDRPYLVVQMSTSVDGRVALGSNRTWWDDLADPRCKNPDPGNDALWREIEANIKRIHNPQAEMQGCGSFVKEGEALKPLPAFEGDPAPLYQDFLPEEIVRRPGHQVWLVVVDGRGRLRTGYKGNENPGNHMLHLTSYAAPSEYLAFLQREKIPYLVAGEPRVDLLCAMQKLKAILGVNCVRSTAGARLNGALLKAGLVDEINLILRPEIIGGFDTPSLFDSPELRPDEWPARLKLISAQVRADGHVWLRYETIASRQA